MQARWLVLVVAGCGARATGPEVAPAPASTARAAGAVAPGRAGAPCFPARAGLPARELYDRLERHSWAAMDPEAAVPAERFGGCEVDRGVVRAADGSIVAELGCGVRIMAAGITDELGLAVGARGADVVARWAGPDAPGHGQLVCTGNGPAQVRCRFDRPDDGDTALTAYVVGGALDAGVDVLAGPAAEAWLGGPTRRLEEIWYSVWCH